MKHLKLSAFLFVLISVTSCGLFEDKSEVISIASGKIQGTQVDGISVYRNIPYAAPPVGNLRWKPPQKVTPWDGIRDASSDGPVCKQPELMTEVISILIEGSGMSWIGKNILYGLIWLNGPPDMSEDCLTLTVRSPDLKENLPVMVWIHGGGHLGGAGNEGSSNSNFIAQQGVVHVSFNYRLGVFGFLAHAELIEEDPHGSAGNYGLLDQIEVLHWVKENIRSFGGDPDNVTLFGESAGAHSIGQIMASPLSKGLFNGAIAQSGTGTYMFQHLPHSLDGYLSGIEAGSLLAQSLDIVGENHLEKLRDQPAEKLLAIASEDTRILFSLHPKVDGWALPKTTAEIFNEGSQAQVPLLLGSNADEGSLTSHFQINIVDGGELKRANSIEMLLKQLKEEFGEKIADLYATQSNNELEKAIFRVTTDTWFGRHAYLVAKEHTQAGNETYFYHFARAPVSPEQTLGATHAAEVQYVFNQFIPFWPTNERDDQLALEMSAYWTNFAKRKNPNGDGLPDWPVFDLSNPEEMVLGDKTFSRPIERRDLYEKLLGQIEMRMESAISLNEAIMPE